MIRNALVAGALATTAVVAIAAVSCSPGNQGHGKSTAAKQALSPTEAAKQVGAQFTGIKQIGVWTLNCVKRHLPSRIDRNAIGAHKERWAEIPKTPMCRVKTRLTYPNDKARWIDVIYHRQYSSGSIPRFTNIFFNMAPGYWTPGDRFELRMDDTVAPAKVLLCARILCAAVPMRKPQELATTKKTAGEQLAAAKHAALIFPPSEGTKGVTIPVPTADLALAAKAMDRVEPISTAPIETDSDQTAGH